MKQNVIIGISGATGIIYAINLLKTLRQKNFITQLVITKAAERTRAYETNLTAKQLHELANNYFPIHNINQVLVNENTVGMIIAPCSMKTLAEVAHQHQDNLLTKSAAQILSEKQPLILLTRETPLHSGHLRNMQNAQRLGATIFPPMINAEYSTITNMVIDTINSIIYRLNSY